jgi:hypothetical protein
MAQPIQTRPASSSGSAALLKVSRFWHIFAIFMAQLVDLMTFDNAVKQLMLFC